MPKRYLQKSLSEKNFDELNNLDLPVFRLVPTLTALLAVPSITLGVDLLVASVSAASGIGNIVLFNLCDNPTNGKVFRDIARAQLLVFDLFDRLELVAAEPST